MDGTADGFVKRNKPDSERQISFFVQSEEPRFKCARLNGPSL